MAGFDSLSNFLANWSASPTPQTKCGDFLMFFCFSLFQRPYYGILKKIALSDLAPCKIYYVIQKLSISYRSDPVQVFLYSLSR